MGLWVVAGLAFPIFMHVVAGSFPWFGYFHFFLSMFACGIISCCLPFLATTWLSVARLLSGAFGEQLAGRDRAEAAD